MDFRVVSIGALGAHPLRQERGAVRTGHATTTLVVSGTQRILIDPGLPDPLLLPRLLERTGFTPAQITDVFLTSFNPEVRRGIGAFDKARWLISPEEREIVGAGLATALKDLVTRAPAQGGVAKDESLRQVLETDVAILRRCEPAPHSIAPRVDVFPLPGVTPGLCGVLLEGERYTTLICGDAVPTIEHVAEGKIPAAPDLDQARASFEEAIEIADLLVPGRDNVMVNPTKRPF